MRHFVRARLHRRIFVWFGMTILLTGLTAFGLFYAIEGGNAWHREMTHVQTFVGGRFARVWDDPDGRAELARAMGQELDVDVRIDDAEGDSLGDFGQAPVNERRAWKMPVVRDGRTLGAVYVAQRKHHGPLAPLVIVFGAGFVLWAMSGLIARRLSRPFTELARVADAIGGGDFTSRVRLRRRHAGEVAALATSINTMAEKIEKQFRDQRELLAAVSHEIRTPLARIRLLLELARERGVDDPGLGEIDREVVEMDALVSELLASSRLDFSATSRADVDAAELARRALDRAGIAADKLVVLADDTRVVADPTLVARALANLVQNARVHGKGLTRLSVRREAGGALAFEAEDAGPGFAAGEAEQIFQPFYRRGEDDGDGKASLGLGLALVRRIAEAHGGRAYARMREEGGAVVGFTLARGVEPLA